MNKNKKWIILLLVLSLFLNIRQALKIQKVKYVVDREVKSHLSEFASKLRGNRPEPLSFESLYEDIFTAHTLYHYVYGIADLKTSTYTTYLSQCLRRIKDLVLDDKEILLSVFSKEQDALRLLMNISNDLNDKDSIKKLFDIVGNISY